MRYLIAISVCVLTLCALLSLPTPIEAGSCHVIVRQTNGYVANKVVVEERKVAVVAVPVYVPTAIFQYLPAIQSPSNMQAPASMPEQNIDEIVKRKLEAMIKEYKLNNPNSSPVLGPPPIVDDETVPVVASRRDWRDVYTRNCASCHSYTERQGGVILFDDKGNFAPNVTQDKLTQVVRSGKMPKKSKLTNADLITLLEHDDELVKQK